MNKQIRKIITLIIILLIVMQIPLFLLYQRDSQELLLAIFLIALVIITLSYGSVVGLYSSLLYLFIIGSTIFYIQLTNNLNAFIPMSLKMSEFFMYGISIIVVVLIAGRVNELFRENAKERTELNEKISKYVAIDVNSGFDNRYRLEKDIMAEIKRANRSNTTFVFVLLEIQYFKSFQQLYGDKETIYLIQELAVNINKIMRFTDKKYRFDDDQFALILPDTSNEYIHVIYDKLAENLKVHQLLNGKLVTLTFRAGHYIYQPNSEVTFDEMIGITKNETMINEI